MASTSARTPFATLTRLLLLSVVLVERNPCMYSIRNLLGGLTQVQLFMLLIPYKDSIRRGLHKEEKDTLKLQMESEQMLKPLAIFL